MKMTDILSNDITKLIETLNERYNWFFNITTDLNTQLLTRVNSDDNSWWQECEFSIKGEGEINTDLYFKVKLVAKLDGGKVHYSVVKPFFAELYEITNLLRDFWFYALLEVIDNN